MQPSARWRHPITGLPLTLTPESSRLVHFDSAIPILCHYDHVAIRQKDGFGRERTIRLFAGDDIVKEMADYMLQHGFEVELPETLDPRLVIQYERYERARARAGTATALTAAPPDELAAGTINYEEEAFAKKILFLRSLAEADKIGGVDDGAQAPTESNTTT